VPARPGDGEGVHDTGWHVDPGAGADCVVAVLEPERQLPGEDEKGLCVEGVDVGRRGDAAGGRADVDDADLLPVRQERDAEVALAGDALAFADARHESAA